MHTYTFNCIMQGYLCGPNRARCWIRRERNIDFSSQKLLRVLLSTFILSSELAWQWLMYYRDVHISREFSWQYTISLLISIFEPWLPLLTKNFRFYLSMGLEWNQVHLYCGNLLAYFIGPVWYCDDCRAISGMNDWQGKPKCSEKTCSSVALSTTGPTWFDPGSNPGRRGGNTANNPLSYCTANCRLVWDNCAYAITLPHTKNHLLLRSVCTRD
jgi:hypothetical protein